MLKNYSGKQFHFTILFSPTVQASATGRCDKTVREFLEQNFNSDVVATERGTVKLAIKALLEVVQSGQKNLEVLMINSVKVAAITRAGGKVL